MRRARHESAGLFVSRTTYSFAPTLKNEFAAGTEGEGVVEDPKNEEMRQMRVPTIASSSLGRVLMNRDCSPLAGYVRFAPRKRPNSDISIGPTSGLMHRTKVGETRVQDDLRTVADFRFRHTTCCFDPAIDAEVYRSLTCPANSDDGDTYNVSE